MKKMYNKKWMIYTAELVVLAVILLISIYLNHVNGVVLFNFYFTDRVFRSLAVWALIFFTTFNVYINQKEFLVKYQTELFFLTMLVFMVSLPLFLPDMKDGHDIIFHLNRIEGIYLGLKSGAFPVRIQPHWFDGHGYPVGAMYGDVFLYLPAFLRFMGFRIETAFKAFALFINILTAGICVYSYRKIFENTQTALMCTLVYLSAPYRMVNLYRRYAVGEYEGMAFLPLICLAMYKIYTTKCEDKKENRKIVLWLVIGMTGLIQTHILTTEMTVFCMALVCIVFYRTTFRKNTLLVYLISIACVIVLNLSFLVPFLDYYRNEAMFINERIGHHVLRSVRANALSIGRYFNFFYFISI